MSTDPTASSSLVESPHFRWLDGMSWTDADQSYWPRYGRIIEGAFLELEDFNECEPDDPRPDADDPATLGCLLALVREAWGRPHIHVEYSDGLWWVYDGDCLLNLTGLRTVSECACADTEHGALEAALLAAPPKTEVGSFEELLRDARSRHTPEGRARLCADDDGHPLQLPPEDRARLLAKYGKGAAPPKGEE